MKRLKHIVLSSILLFLCLGVSAQDFEGVIILIEKHRSSEITKRITVKGDFVKLETFASKDTTNLKGAKIVNLQSGKVTALLPSRKLYFDIPNKMTRRPFTAEITPSDEKKTISVTSDTSSEDYECKKFMVSSKEKKAQVTYWVTKGNFTFYLPLMEALSKNENISDFFGKLSEKHPGVMPMSSVERKPDGTKVGGTKIIEITSKSISSTAFEIPEGYSLMER